LPGDLCRRTQARWAGGPPSASPGEALDCARALHPPGPGAWLPAEADTPAQSRPRPL